MHGIRSFVFFRRRRGRFRRQADRRTISDSPTYSTSPSLPRKSHSERSEESPTRHHTINALSFIGFKALLRFAQNYTHNITGYKNVTREVGRL